MHTRTLPTLVVPFCKTFLLALLLAFPAWLTAALRSGDRQLWSQLSVEKRLNNRWSVYGGNEMRLGDGGRDFYFRRLDAGVIYKLKPWLSTALGCKAFWSEKPDHWPVTRMPVMDLWLYAPMHSLQITWQHKWEYQVAEQGGAAVVHRQKITLAAARPWSVWKVQPFMAGEFFYNFNLEHVSFRRWFSGFYLQPPNQPLRLGLQYLLQESWSPARQTLYHCLIFYAKLTW